MPYHMITVKIDYFKPTGKWYAEGSFEMELEAIEQSHLNCLPVPKKINEMRDAGIRPGLVNSKNCEFVWVVKVMFLEEVYMQYLFQPKGLEQAAKEFWSHS